jgi:type II secretory pathway component PulK
MNRRGTALIIVLWIALALVSVALYFAHSARLAYLAADNALAGARAEQAVNSAARYFMNVLTTLNEPGKLPSLADSDYLAEDVVVSGDARFWIIGRDNSATATPLTPVYGVVDEASRLNLNTATLEMLELLPNMTTELAAAIVDWRDLDSDLTSGGAEAQDYLLLDEPYLAKDDSFETPEEMRLLNDADLQLLYGEDVNRNGILDPNEDDGTESFPDDDADGTLDFGVLEYLTTFSREPNTQGDGSARINLSGTVSQTQISDQLAEALGQTRAEEIMTRLGGAITSVNSPLEFFVLSGITADEFAQVEPRLSSQGGDYAIGLVNVNTAPSAVLRCLPGMTEELADELVAARLTKDEETLSSVAWVAGTLPADVAEQIGPYITTKSYQFSLDVAAVAQGGRGFRRALFVIDFEDESRVIYRRDLARLGNPFPAELRETISMGEEQ